MVATSSPTINGKPIRIVGTSNWDSKYGGLEAILYVKDALKALRKKPVDMLVFEMADESTLQIRSAGYDLATDSILDEESILLKTESLHVDKFFFKLDDYGDMYVGTFLMPEDY